MIAIAGAQGNLAVQTLSVQYVSITRLCKAPSDDREAVLQHQSRLDYRSFVHLGTACFGCVLISYSMLFCGPGPSKLAYRVAIAGLYRKMTVGPPEYLYPNVSFQSLNIRP